MAIRSFVEQIPTTAGRLCFGDAPPSLSTDGTWRVGDLILNIDPASGEPFLWRCVTAGAPGTWEAVGAAAVALTTATAITLDASHDTVIADTTAGVVTVTLPAASAVPGKSYTVKRVGATNAVNVAGAIDAGTTQAALATNQAAVKVVSDGTAWRIIHTFGTVTVT